MYDQQFFSSSYRKQKTWHLKTDMRKTFMQLPGQDSRAICILLFSGSFTSNNIRKVYHIKKTKWHTSKKVLSTINSNCHEPSTPHTCIQTVSPPLRCCCYWFEQVFQLISLHRSLAGSIGLSWGSFLLLRAIGGWGEVFGS